MVIFRAMCGEWIESWFDYVLVGGTWSIVYFAALALVGSFVVSYYTHDALICYSSPTSPHSSTQQWLLHSMEYSDAVIQVS